MNIESSILLASIFGLFFLGISQIPDYTKYKAGEYREYEECDVNKVYCYFNREYKEE